MIPRITESRIALPYDGRIFWMTNGVDIQDMGFYSVDLAITSISESNMRYALGKLTEMERFGLKGKS